MKHLKLAESKRVSSSPRVVSSEKRVHNKVPKAPVSKAVVTKYGKCGNITFVPREIRHLLVSPVNRKSKDNILHRSSGSQYAVNVKKPSHIAIRQVFEGKGWHSGKVKQDSTTVRVPEPFKKKSKLSIHHENRGKSSKIVTKGATSPVGSKKLSKRRNSERNVNRSETFTKPTFRRCFACEQISKTQPHIFTKKTKSLPVAHVNSHLKSENCHSEEKQHGENHSEPFDRFLNVPVYYGITPVMTSSQRVLEWLQNIPGKEEPNYEKVVFSMSKASQSKLERRDVEKSIQPRGRRNKCVDEKINASSQNALSICRVDTKAEICIEKDFPKERHKTWKHERSRINMKVSERLIVGKPHHEKGYQ